MYVYVIMKIIHTQTNKTRSLIRKYNIYVFFGKSTMEFNGTGIY